MEKYQVSPQGFSEIVANYEPITPALADEKIQAGNQEIIFIGRPTCPFCQKFAPKLQEVVDQHDLTVYYIFSQDSQHQAEIDALREKYDIKTVPALIYTDQPVKIKCDSSMSIEEITAFVGK